MCGGLRREWKVKDWVGGYHKSLAVKGLKANSTELDAVFVCV